MPERTFRLALLTLGAGLLLAAGLGAAVYRGWLRFNYPSRAEFPVQGIDVAHHQGLIRWAEVDTQQVQFVYIKATEGGDYRDPRFAQNWREARQRGLAVGAYHFFTFCRSGAEQARNFVATVPAEPATLPPVIDLEFGGNCRARLRPEQVRAEIDTLRQALARHYRRPPVFYVTAEFYETYLAGHFPGAPIWYRDIYRRPRPLDKRPWLFWQYANRGHRPGIDGYVDLNAFHGSRAQFRALLGGAGLRP
jgi:lysozyme